MPSVVWDEVLGYLCSKREDVRRAGELHRQRDIEFQEDRLTCQTSVLSAG
jgi:hypothetical protein